MLLHSEPWVRQAVHVINVGLDLIIRYIYYYLSAPPSCDLNRLKCSFTPDEFADLNGTHYNDSTGKRPKSAGGKSSSCRISFSAERNTNTKATEYVTFGFYFSILVFFPF